MIANWHVRNEDRARLRAELAALDARLHQLDMRRTEASNRQRYSRSAEEAARAGDDLKKPVTEMDRLMTRSRAVEGKLLLLQKLAQKSVDPVADPDNSFNDVSQRLTVEVFRDPPDPKVNQ